MEVKAGNYHDFSGLASLRRAAGESPEEAALPVAQQFEALFLQMMLKSMRDAVPDGGLFSDGGQKMYREMLDSQLSVNLSEQGGIGLAPVIARQISQQTPAAAPGAPAAAPGNNASAQSLQLQLRQTLIQNYASSADTPMMD